MRCSISTTQAPPSPCSSTCSPTSSVEIIIYTASTSNAARLSPPASPLPPMPTQNSLLIDSEKQELPKERQLKVEELSYVVRLATHPSNSPSEQGIVGRQRIKKASVALLKETCMKHEVERAKRTKIAPNTFQIMKIQRGDRADHTLRNQKFSQIEEFDTEVFPGQITI